MIIQNCDEINNLITFSVIDAEKYGLHSSILLNVISNNEFQNKEDIYSKVRSWMKKTDFEKAFLVLKEEGLISEQ